MKILVIHGPNLNLLGEREPKIYGKQTMAQINSSLSHQKNATLNFFQSNHEGEIIDFIHKNRKWADGILINPGGLTHYSISLRDAIAAVNLPTVEVHLSNINKREKFRKVNVIKDVCDKQFMGKDSYQRGLMYLVRNV